MIAGRKWLLILCAALVSAMPVAGWAAPVNATVKSVVGKVEFAAPGTVKFEPLKAGSALPMGSTIRTGSDGIAVIVVAGGAAIRVGYNSNMVLGEMDVDQTNPQAPKRKGRVELKSGVASALVDPSQPEPVDFTIKTPQGAAAARGTFFAVMVEGDKSFLAVDEGKVGVQLNNPAHP